ncbi:MAG: HAMP domain-containing protein [Bryobacterales bacterium]
MNRRRSIRLRLTLWYSAVLAAGMIVLNLVTWFALHEALMSSYAGDLENRLAAFASFVEQEAAGHDRADLLEEAREYSTGLPEGDSLRVLDSEGTVLFEHGTMAAESIERSRLFKIRGHEVRLELSAPLHDYYETLGVLRRVMIGVSPVVLALAVLGGGWLARRSLQPVDELTREARAIDEKDLKTRLSVPATGDELQRLAETLNDLLSRIKLSPQRDSFHRRRRARAADPGGRHSRIHRACAAATTVCAGLPRSARGDQKETLHVTTLLDQLLTLARGDAGALELEFDALPVGSLLRQSLRSAAPLAESKGLRLGSVLPDKDSLIWADEAAARRLL